MKCNYCNQFVMDEVSTYWEVIKKHSCDNCIELARKEAMEELTK